MNWRFGRQSFYRQGKYRHRLCRVAVLPNGRHCTARFPSMPLAVATAANWIIPLGGHGKLIGIDGLDAVGAHPDTKRILLVPSREARMHVDHSWSAVSELRRLICIARHVYTSWSVGSAKRSRASTCNAYTSISLARSRGSV